MEHNYNEVHVLGDNTCELKEIHPEYVYLTIPAEYVCVYHKLLIYMADFGKKIVDDCTTSCKGNGKNILTCWNLFQSAVAAKTLGRDKEAEFFINYIKLQLDNIYKGTGKKPHSSSVPIAVTKDGKLKAIVSCGDETKFMVDPSTGKLYEEYLADQDTKVYVLEDNNLTVNINNETNV